MVDFHRTFMIIKKSHHRTLLSKKKMKRDSEHKDVPVAKHQHGMKNIFFQPERVEHERDSCVWSRRTEERMESAQTPTWKKKQS